MTGRQTGQAWQIGGGRMSCAKRGRRDNFRREDVHGGNHHSGEDVRGGNRLGGDAGRNSWGAGGEMRVPVPPADGRCDGGGVPQIPTRPRRMGGREGLPGPSGLAAIMEAATADATSPSATNFQTGQRVLSPVVSGCLPSVGL